MNFPQDHATGRPAFFMRQIHLSLGALCLLLLAGVWTCPAAPRPNFLILVAQGLGQEWLGCYGSEGGRTPHLDRLAAGGVRFQTCYATPYGSSSRNVLLTGRYPFRNGWLWHNDAPAWGVPYFDGDRELTFARHLRDAGYATAIAGQWQLNDLRAQPDALRRAGFDEHCVWPGAERGGESGTAGEGPWLQINGRRRRHPGRSSPDLCAEFLTDFARRNRERPFLAFHPMPGPEVTPPGDIRPPAELPDDNAGYKARVGRMDQAIGGLVAAIAELKLDRPTVVVFAADSGSPGTTVVASGRVVKGGQGRLSEAGINVPLIISAPGLIAGGRVTDRLTDFSDLFPTLCDLAGLRAPRAVTLDGHSLAPWLLRAEPGGRREWIFSQYGHDRVIRDARYKLHSNGRLFDVLTDPAEQNDLGRATVSEIQGVKERLAGLLRALPKDEPLDFPLARRLKVRRPGE